MFEQTGSGFECLRKKMPRGSLTLIVIAAIVCFWNAGVSPAELKARDVLRYADRARGNLEGVEWEVDVYTNEKGVEQERELDVKARGYDFLATMTSPPKVKGSKLLMVDHNMWYTKPGLRKPVPVSSRQKLIGGASYGDIAATNYADDYKAASVESGSYKEESCYVFDLQAHTKKATYDRIKYWISKKRIVGVKAEYYTVSGKMFKWAYFNYSNQISIGGKRHPFISKMTIKDALIEDQITTMTFNRPKLVKVPPSALDVNLLQIR